METGKTPGLIRVVSCNVNGIRSAAAKGFFDWIQSIDADLICLQEVRAKATDGIPALDGMQRFVFSAKKPGYAGVAIYTRHSPDDVVYGLAALAPRAGWHAIDEEGRFLMLKFGQIHVASVYFPSGASSPKRQAAKLAFLERFLPLASDWVKRGEEWLICADVNIAHRRIDLRNWRGNRKHSGFLPEERAWFDRFLAAGYVDVFRSLHPQREAYSWWSNRGRAREKNIGWRIDYHLATASLADRAKHAWIHDRHVRFSDHAPVVVDYALSI